MVALRGRDIDVFLKAPDPARPIILLYGPDAGLVRERADALVKSAVDDPADPFSLVRMDGDELSAEPSRLVEEAMTIPMFGGRRAIRVRAGSRSFASGVDTLSEMPIKDCRIVIEAGELRPESPLRKACERAKTAVAIGCYPDGERDLAKLIDEELRVSNLRIAPDARAVLMSLLGGDRQASRNELRKLALYAHGAGEATLDDVMAVVADASELKLDPIVDAAFAGNSAVVESEFAKARRRGCTNRRSPSPRELRSRCCSRADFRGCIFRGKATSKSRCAISARRGWSESSTSLRPRRWTCANRPRSPP
jgi:DNA polymerase-3 subunit delta